LFQDIVTVINLAWKKFHFPVYSAGFLLCPYFRDEFVQLLRDDPEVGKGIIADTVDCLVTLFRRFDERGRPREYILCQSVAEAHRSEFAAQLKAYYDVEVPFHTGLFAHLSGAPSDIWRLDMPSKTLDGEFLFLRSAAIMVCNLAPESTENEKAHDLFKSQRVKKRNKLGYARAHGLNFICWEDRNVEYEKTHKIDWVSIQSYKKRFCEELATVDREFLVDMAREAEEERVERETAANEEQLVVVGDGGETETALPVGWARATTADDEEYFYHLLTDEVSWSFPNAEAASTPPPPPPPPQVDLPVELVSSRGRAVRKRNWGPEWTV
jgi:hypothetical protein